MLESYIRTGDGKDYVDVDCVREALGIKEDENIFLAIKKLREERERYKSNCDYFAGIAQDRLRDRNKLELELREALGTVDEYADIPGLVRKLKKEREEFIRELSCSLGFGNPVVKPDNIDQKEKDILERVEKLKDGVWPCENSSTFAEHLRKEFPKFCKRYNIVPLTNASIHDWITYIFDVLAEYRDLTMELDRKCIDLTAKNSDLQQKFEFQSGLRQQWHARYESEHERANGVQKTLDREREKCRVKDISLETAKKQYEKVCGNLETAEYAINGMKSKVLSLREEKTKVITALGQDIWDDCLK